MGKSGGGTNTVESSSAPPADVMAQYDKIIAQANNAASAPLQQYSGNIVAPFNSTQNQAFDEVQNAQGTSQPLYNQAQGLIQNASQQITPQTVNSADIAQYQNPYTQQVINSTMANINQQDAGQQSQLMGNAASQGAWGGDRSAVAQSLLANQQDLANNQTISGLESQGYSQALGEANTQQQAALSAQEASQYLGQQGGSALTNLGTTEQNAALTGASALTSVGGLQQQLEQEQLNVPYEQFQQQQSYPYQNLGWLAGISTGLGSGEGGTTSTTSPAASLTSQLGGLGLTGLGIYGASGGFGGSTAAAAARGGRIEGLIKRLNNGGAVMMPAHYDKGGLIKHYDNGGIIPGQMTVQEMENSAIPDLTQSARFNVPQMSRGIGVPSMMKSSGQNSTTTGGSNGVGGSAGVDIAAAKGAKSLYNSLSNSLYDPTQAASVTLDTSPSAMASTFPGGAGNASGMFDSATSPSISSQFASGLSGDTGIGLDTASSLGEAGATDLGGSAAVDAAPAAVSAATDAGIFDTIGTTVMQALPFLAALFNKGGAVSKGFRHYDNGGLVPSDTTDNPMLNNVTSQYANMSSEQLQQLLPRVQQPQTKQIIQKVLQQKQVMPNTGNVSNIAPSAPTAPQATMQRGGIIKHYDDGGATDTDYLTQLTQDSTSAPNASSAPADLPSLGLVKDDPSLVQTTSLPISSAPNSPGLIKDSPAPSNFTPIPLPTFHDDQPTNKVDPWLSVAAAGAAMMASKSPHALEALGQGAQEGLQNYGSQKKEAAEEAYKNGTIQDARNQLVSEVELHNQQGKHDADALNNTIQNQAAERAQAALNAKNAVSYQQSELALRNKELTKPELIKDMMGNPIGWATPGATDIKPLTGMPDYMGNNGGVSNTQTNNGTAPQTSINGLSKVSAGTQLSGKLSNAPAAEDIDTYLSKYPPAVATHAAAIAAGEEQWPTGFSTKNPILMQAATVAREINPNITQAAYPTFLNFTNGPNSKIARSLDVSVAHLDTLGQLADAMNNGDTKVLNSISNTFKSQFGQPAPTNFDTAKQIVADEVVKAVIGAGGTGGDREAAQKVINSANSPEQLHQAISTYKTLMAGQLQGLQQTYETGTGRGDFQQRILTQKARDALNPSVQQNSVSSPKIINWTVQNGKLVQTP